MAVTARTSAAIRHHRGHRLLWAVAGLLAALSTRAHAQPSPAITPAASSEAPRPWAAGVSEAEQATALELYVAGNREFAEARFAQALANYKEALQHWDHPAIRFNMAVCQISIEQRLEAKDNLERSLVYGDRPLGADAYRQGLTYRKLLDAQLAHVQVDCPEPGTQVTLDGKYLLTGPGTADRFLLPGEHQVVASKVGFLTASEALVLVAGKRTIHDIRPLAFKAATRTVRRWEAWKPWAVLAGGGAVVGAGALSYVAAAHNIASYDHEITARCPEGCYGDTAAKLSSLRPLTHRSRIEQLVAFSLFSAGGAVVIAGVIGLIVNQPRTQLDPDQPLPTVAPAPGGATVSMSWGF